MARTHVRRRRGLAGLLLVAAVWQGGGATRTYVVRPGDTLWSIATALEPGADPREVVWAVTRQNDLDPGGLVPGQRIAIPTVG